MPWELGGWEKEMPASVMAPLVGSSLQPVLPLAQQAQQWFGGWELMLDPEVIWSAWLRHSQLLTILFEDRPGKDQSCRLLGVDAVTGQLRMEKPSRVLAPKDVGLEVLVLGRNDCFYGGFLGRLTELAPFTFRVAPGPVYRNQRRRSQRFPVRQPVQVGLRRPKDLEPTRTGWLLDIGYGGISMLSGADSFDWSPGQKWFVTPPALANEASLEIEAEVRHLQVREPQGLQVGLQWYPTPKAREHLGERLKVWAAPAGA